MRAVMYASAADMEVRAREWTLSLESRRRWEDGPGKTALLVLDMQRYFLEKGGAFLPTAPSIIGPIESLLKVFKGPVIFTKHIESGDPLNLMNRWWKGSMRARDSEVVDVLGGYAEVVLDKFHYSAFFGTELESMLRRSSVESVLVSGVMTDLCCETTARDAFMRGFKVYFLSDCTATATEERHVAALRAISEGFGEVITSKDAMSLL